jgi:hypothetical protein
VKSSTKSPFKWRHAPSETDPDKIVILEKWALLNITSFACEPLSRWTSGRSRIVTLNHSVKDPFLKLWDRWEHLGLLERLTTSLSEHHMKPTWGGGWVARYKRGAAHDANPSNLSSHASGHAFDICPAAYPLGRPVKGEDIMQALADTAEEMGWTWGGRFRSRPDGMHYQHISSPLG